MGDRWIRAMRVRSEQGPAGGGYGGYSVRQVPRMVLSLRLLLSEVLLSQMYSSPRVSRLSVCSGGRRSASNWRRRMNTFCFSLIRSSMAVILQSSRWAAAVSPLALSGCPPPCAHSVVVVWAIKSALWFGIISSVQAPLRAPVHRWASEIAARWEVQAARAFIAPHTSRQTHGGTASSA